MLTTQEKLYKSDALRVNKVFSTFTDEEFKKLQKMMRFRKYKKGQILFEEGDRKDKFFYLIEGLVKLERYDESAIYMYTDYVKEDRLFPYGEIFADDVYRYTAYALTDIELYSIPANIFEEVLSGNAKQLLYFYKRLTDILIDHEERIQYFVGTSASSRIVKALAYLMNELGESGSKEEVIVSYPITVCEIATISGCSRETVGNKVKQLKEMGKLEHNHKILTFKDIDYFKEYSED
ncbi:Crp/Fnr family transcriptional regulator [Desemzia sp. RIT804]|uniref:Crp/Fnr family transcriptional regulator n=1 Tax=Desemzia sp. RIT 804 TaxID=2810209 RepID=UPI001950B534|nr:Crp/Fnr family transcriptional regulator [Desemzia sp. RIT 804]MBM6613274.1 Crp/Fnr family transcriptional regulator [Desemzia sp. RIT 804]